MLVGARRLTGLSVSLDESIERARRERERQLYAAGVSQLAVIEREYGYLEVRIYPSVDGFVAASVLASILRGKNLDVWMVADPLPPSRVETPSVLIGYGAGIAVSGEYRAPAIVVARGERPQGLTRAALVAASNASHTSLVLGMLSEVTVVGDKGLLGLAMGYWLSLDQGREGDFEGPDLWLAELLEVENRAIGALTVKLFDWFEAPLETALSSTIDPFYPGLSGHPEEAVKFLEADPETAKLVGRSVVDAEEEPLARLAERLYEHLRASSRRARKPTEVLGRARYTKRLPVEDLRKLGNIIAAWIDFQGLLGAAPIASSLDRLVLFMNGFYESRLEGIVRGIERGYKVKGIVEIREYGPVRVCIHHGLEGSEPYTPIAKQLMLLGVYNGCLAGVDRGDRIEVLLDPLLADVRLEKVWEAVRKGCLVYRESSLYAEARSC